MPRSFVEQRTASPHALCLRPLSASSSPLGRLAQDALIALQRDVQLIPEADFQTACRLVGDLLLLAYGGSEAVQAGGQSVRHAMLATVKRTIRARLDDSDLTLAEVADACGISLGYLHKLFRDEGCTVWEFLKSERLTRARQLLETPAAHTTVTEVALSCGYANLSQFSTAFRQAFGVSPRELLRGSAF